MSTTYPTPPRVERKVKVAAIWTYVGACALLGVLNGVSDANLVTVLPDWAEVVFGPLVPAALAGVGGYVAKHTPRPDLPSSQR